MSTGIIRVLVVEDDATNAQVARTMLERLGCIVHVAENGAEAIKLFGDGEYELILMDWQMPVMDGLEATARIRRMPRGRDIPIIGTSARMTRAECMAAGMSDRMPKPFLFKKVKLELSSWTTWIDNRQARSAEE